MKNEEKPETEKVSQLIEIGANTVRVIQAARILLPALLNVLKNYASLTAEEKISVD